MLIAMVFAIDGNWTGRTGFNALEKQADKSLDSKTPVKNWPDKIDLGEHRIGQEVPFSFDISNQKSSEMIVEKIWASCSCVSIESKPGGVLPSEKYVVKGTMRLGSFGKFEQIVYVSTKNESEESEAVIAVKLLGSALSGPKLVESSKTISIASFDDLGFCIESILVPASVADKRYCFDSVTWDREKNPFVRFWIENREEGVGDSRLFVALRSDAPSESQLMVGLESSGPDGNDSVQLSLKILNCTIASIIPQMAVVEPDGSVRVWLIVPANNPPSRVFYKLIDEDGTVHGSTECNMEDYLDGDALSWTKVVSMKMPLSALTTRQILVARLFDESEKELGTFRVLLPTD